MDESHYIFKFRMAIKVVRKDLDRLMVIDS